MQTRQHICFLTGPPQCGKTSFLLNILAELRREGWRLGGFAAHGLWRDGLRSGFDLEVLATGERVPLTGRSPDCPERGGYIFYPAGFAVGLQALAPAALNDKDLITVDEIGWLEVRGDGFGPALPELILTPAPQIWIVRDAMLEGVCAHWQFTPALVVRPDQTGARETLINWLQMQRSQLSAQSSL